VLHQLCRTSRSLCRGVARRVGAGQSSIEWIFLRKKLALLGRKACFSKVTLFCLSEVRNVVFIGPQISQIYGPCCWERATTKKVNFFEKKVHTRSFYSPSPQCKILPTRLSSWPNKLSQCRQWITHVIVSRLETADTVLLSTANFTLACHPWKQVRLTWNCVSRMCKMVSIRATFWFESKKLNHFCVSTSTPPWETSTRLAANADSDSVSLWEWRVISPPENCAEKNGKIAQNLRKNCAKNWRGNCARIDKTCARVHV